MGNNGLWEKNQADLLIGYRGGKEIESICRQRPSELKITASVGIWFFVGIGSAAFMLLHGAGILHSHAHRIG